MSIYTYTVYSIMGLLLMQNYLKTSLDFKMIALYLKMMVCLTYVLSDIYPTEMVLENTNISENECNYLDLNIAVSNDSYCFKSYDKRKEFGFEIVNYPNLYGNIPIAPAYGVFVSQLFRLCKINGSIDSFIVDLKDIISKLVKQGFKLKHLKNKFLNFVNMKLQTWLHLGKDISAPEFLESVFCDNSV